MARVRKDKGSYRASGIFKKDFKEYPEKAKHSSKKDKKRWCKGRVGIVHVYTMHLHSEMLGMKLVEFICDVCGRKVWRCM